MARSLVFITCALASTLSGCATPEEFADGPCPLELPPPGHHALRITVEPIQRSGSSDDHQIAAFVLGTVELDLDGDWHWDLSYMVGPEGCVLFDVPDDPETVLASATVPDAKDDTCTFGGYELFETKGRTTDGVVRVGPSCAHA